MTNRKLDSLQVLRGFAATAVVFFHAFRSVQGWPVAAKPSSWIEPHPALVAPGAFGVDVFFVLSGFLMMYIAGPYFRGEQSPGRFLAQRLLRIWPLYALASAALLALELLHHNTFDLHPLRLLGFVFVPSLNAGGQIQPILGVGWTLNYEMFFYAAFALVLRSGPRLALAKLAVLLMGAVLAGHLLAGPVVGPFLANTQIFEFLFGATVGDLVRQGRFQARKPMPWLAAGALGLTALPFEPASAPSGLVAGLPALLLLIGFLGLEGTRWPALLRLIGNASYSIYLTHTMLANRAALQLLNHMPAPLKPLGVLIAGSIATAIGVAGGVACYLLLEKPILALSRRLFLDRGASVRRLPPAVQPAE